MKIRVIAFLITVILSHLSFGQGIIGLWQEDSPEITDGYYNTYEFKKDGTFKFQTNQYFGLSRIISFEGKYELHGNRLTLIVLNKTELIGGNLERSESEGTATHSWVISGAQTKKTNLPKPYKTIMDIEQGLKDKEKDDAPYILFDKYKFYKLTA